MNIIMKIVHGDVRILGNPLNSITEIVHKDVRIPGNSRRELKTFH